jgi:hypothetical protein
MDPRVLVTHRNQSRDVRYVLPLEEAGAPRSSELDGVVQRSLVCRSGAAVRFAHSTRGSRLVAAHWLLSFLQTWGTWPCSMTKALMDVRAHRSLPSGIPL